MTTKTSNLQEDTSSEKMATLSDLVNKAVKKGYAANFNVKPNGMLWDSKDQYYDPLEVSIDDFYRFEGESDPADSAILYLISTADGNRGTLIDAYGAYDDANASEFIRQVTDIHKQKQRMQISQRDRKRYWAAAALLTISGLLFIAMGKCKRC
ncbi:hypothetical protein U0035_22075 [Niabella yanshanensis]|uniref:Phosphoribosylpyrophosphate synthetase n=1 Tax=Niabella yanshanensis TaxID=577386 RepID=A0ABZ0W8P2_9BACT|nr:hypothetical protein [Niabella yanshanensis]WQD38365.1 hypothetical protein U0035_22075 [Niabella yanshanensis]